MYTQFNRSIHIVTSSKPSSEGNLDATSTTSVGNPIYFTLLYTLHWTQIKIYNCFRTLFNRPLRCQNNHRAFLLKFFGLLERCNLAGGGSSLYSTVVHKRLKRDFTITNALTVMFKHKNGKRGSNIIEKNSSTFLKIHKILKLKPNRKSLFVTFTSSKWENVTSRAFSVLQ